MFNKKKEREEPKIEGSSLADIAFLLLIFFLVATTIDIDTGIGLVLPPEPEENQDPPPIKERNLLKILVNSQGQVLIEEEPSAVNEVKQKVTEFIRNPNNESDLSVSPQDAVVSIKTDRQTPYNIYINMLDEVMGAYEDIRNQAARAEFGVPFEQLKQAQKDKIKDMYPKKISIAEPDKGAS